MIISLRYTQCATNVTPVAIEAIERRANDTQISRDKGNKQM